MGLAQSLLALNLLISAHGAPRLAFSSRAVLGGHAVAVAIADTPAARHLGLSGQASLAPGHGLVLAYASPAVVRIWMPDMHFPLDVVFVASGKIAAIDANEPPCVPGRACPAFGPDLPVDWVLELPAGSAGRWRLSPGEPARLDQCTKTKLNAFQSGALKLQPD